MPVVVVLVFLALGLLPTRSLAEALVLTADRAVQAPDVRIDHAGQVLPLSANGTTAEEIAPAEVMFLRFDVRPRHSLPRAWLCLIDGRRVSGDSLDIAPDRVVLKSAGGPDVAASRKELAALFYKATRPVLKPPEAGVRIISTNGDTLDAPAIELTDTGVIVEVSPEADPIHLSRERVAGVIWPARPAAAVKKAAGSSDARQLVELRGGQRLIGRVTSLDQRVLILNTGQGPRTIHRRELRAVWFGRREIRPVEDQLSPPPVSRDRPSYRRGANALGSPLRIGRRFYRHGLGVRGPAAIDVSVPANARWFVADVGADADAAPVVRLSFEILVDGQRRMQRDGVSPGQPPQRVAVPVAGAKKITLLVRPTGHDPTGCLGDFADAIFIE